MNEYINNIRLNSEVAEDFFAEKLAFTLGPVELQQMASEGKVKILDVRLKEDYEASHIPGAISMPKSEMAERKNELSQKEIHVVYCYNQQCHLAASCALHLAQNNYPVMELEGGFKTWVDDFGFDVE